MLGMDISPIARAVQKVGLKDLEKGLGITYQAIRRWERNGRMPRTEWTGETDYGRRIELLTEGEVTDQQLRAWSEARLREPADPIPADPAQKAA